MIDIQRLRLPLALLSLIIATPALAQDPTTPPDKPDVFDGDWLTIGAGVAYGPSYEGSDAYVAYPMPAIIGNIGGVGINPRQGGLALDFIDDPRGAKISFQAGPVGRLRFDRNRQIKDPVVAALGKRKVAVELGGTAGFAVNRITNPYDSLSFSVDVRHDVAGAHGGTIIAPGMSFQTPLSRGSFAALSVNAEHVDGKYARYYYSVSPGDSRASGLPVYDARGGWKNVSAGLLGAIDLDGDLTNGGFVVVAGGNYSRLLGSFEDAPVIAQRGTRDQFTAVIGIGYTF
jgi:outer membrane scaffolding protein for murein synthesis (MipA/OmpV family)